MGNMPETERVLAAATGSTGGLGKIGVVAATTGTLLVRLDNTGFGRTSDIDWRVKTDQASTVQPYRATGIVDSATLTLAAATRVDDADTCVLNGLTYTAESTAADAAWATRKWKSAGADEAADAAELAKVINADYAITPNGSVTVGDTITVTTEEGAFVYTAAAAPSYTTRVFDQSGNQAAELASIVLALNHRRNITLASCTAGQKVYIDRPGHARYVYTAHADTTSGTNFAINGTDSQDATALATAINTQTASHGYVATAVAAAVHVARGSAAVPEPNLSSSNGTMLACVNIAGGVPGVAAVATGATGELGITPVWVGSLTVATSNGTRLAIADIDNPGLLATAAAAVITLTPGTPGMPTDGELCSLIQFAQGTSDAAEIAFASTTLASLVKDGAVTTISASNATCAGQIVNQSVKGWPAAYLLFSNTAGTQANVTIAATRY